jgi:hypothetical protein
VSAPPVTTPRPSQEPSVSPEPSAPASPQPTAPTFSDAERYLLDGVLRGATDCEPVRSDLPTGAVAGIECDSPETAVARIGFYLFENDAAMLDAYLARMTAEGVTVDSGGCVDGESEGAYTPGEGTVPYRDGCFINDAGFANYRATLPGAHLYIGILGRTADTGALQSFAWVGSQDTPGNPTLWGEPG